VLVSKNLGFGICSKRARPVCRNLNMVRIPSGIDDCLLCRGRLLNECNLGNWALVWEALACVKVWRIGLMGYGVTKEMWKLLFYSLRQVLMLNKYFSIDNLSTIYPCIFYI